MTQPRKIEYFRDQLNESPQGRQVLALVRQHSSEVMYLITKNRPTMVAWQRLQGPKFVRSFVDSGFEEDTPFIREVDGIHMEQLLLQMAEVLQDNGSMELKQTIGSYTHKVIGIARETTSLRQLIQRINNTPILEING
jgi:hypothetical protein